MKIVIPTHYVVIVDDGKFVSSVFDGNIISLKYEQKQPYQLSIKIDYNHCEAILEFTGKILGDRYPELISRDTISVCLQRIRALSLIQFNADEVIRFGQVYKCDVTTDVAINDIEGLNRFLQINSSTKFRSKSVRYTNGTSISNNVTTDRYKKRMAVYDKQKELGMAVNSQFLDSLSDKEALLSYFNGKVRFERNLTTKEAIRKALGVADNSVERILEANATPIIDMLREVIKTTDSTLKPNDIKDLTYEIILSHYDFDLVKLEAALRSVASPNTRMSRVMIPYQEYLNRRDSLLIGGFKFEDLIRKLPY